MIGRRTGLALRAFLARALAVLVLFIATPGPSDVARELVTHLTGIDACGSGGCDDDGDAPCCPSTCLHCACCSHAGSLPSALAVHLAAPFPSGACDLGCPGPRPYSSGEPSPPFRPPAA